MSKKIIYVVFFAIFLVLSPWPARMSNLAGYFIWNLPKNEYYWDFRDGFPPNYSGWGDLKIVSEGIQLSDTHMSYCGVIFTPFQHNPEWGMETLVKVTDIDYHAGEMKGAIAILTRDSSKVNCESTFGIYPNTTIARCRHKINGIDEIGYHEPHDGGIIFTLPFKIQLNVWYKLRFVFYQGNLECYINGTKYFEKAGLSKSSVVYTQPHLGIHNGTTIFQYIRIWSLGS
jgi:hypothetical protein